VISKKTYFQNILLHKNVKTHVFFIFQKLLADLTKKRNFSTTNIMLSLNNKTLKHPAQFAGLSSKHSNSPYQTCKSFTMLS